MTDFSMGSRSYPFSFSTLVRDLLPGKARIVWHMILFIALVLTLGFVSLLGGRAGIRGTAVLLPLTGFLLLGVGNLFFLKNRLSVARREIPVFCRQGWYFTLLLMLVILAVLIAIYFFVDKDRLPLALAASCLFVLPFTMAHAWSVFSVIPERQYKVWYYPKLPDNLAMPLIKSMPLRIKMRRRYYDIHEDLFTTTVPVRIKLGNLFYHFIQDQQKKNDTIIEMTDDQKNPFGWEFYRMDFGGAIKKFLDPGLTLIENKVKENAVIIARRVKTDRPLLIFNHK